MLFTIAIIAGLVGLMLMAYDADARELVTDSETTWTAEKRYKPDEDGVNPKTFAAGSGDILHLTPVAYNTSTNKWVVWATGGSNGTGIIGGFLCEPQTGKITLASGGEVLGNVMTHGIIHFGDIVVAGGTEAELKTALRTPSTKAVTLKIQGLPRMRYA